MVLFYIMNDHGNELQISQNWFQTHIGLLSILLLSLVILFLCGGLWLIVDSLLDFGDCWILESCLNNLFFWTLSRDVLIDNDKNFKKLKINRTFGSYAPFSGYSHLKVSHLLHLFGPNITCNNHIDTICKKYRPSKKKNGDNYMSCFWNMTNFIWNMKMILHAWWSSSVSLLSERHPSSLISCSSFKGNCSKDTLPRLIGGSHAQAADKFDQLMCRGRT